MLTLSTRILKSTLCNIADKCQINHLWNLLLERILQQIFLCHLMEKEKEGKMKVSLRSVIIRKLCEMKTVRWGLIAISMVLMFSLCGCSFLTSAIIEDKNESLSNDNEIVENNTIQKLKGWSFQSNSATNDYSLFFGLLNENDEYIAADIDVDIRIVNDAGEEVYSATKSVTSVDFGNYESKANGKQYLANVRIPASDIKSGKSDNGTVYLTVYQGDTVRFDEVNCEALYCLPVADVNLSAEGLPVKINVRDYDGSINSVLKITDVSYVFEKDVSWLKITFSGEKIDGRSSTYDTITYKLYDSDGYLVDSSNVYLSSLSVGDKFKDDSITIYDVVPGENYTIQFTEYR